MRHITTYFILFVLLCASPFYSFAQNEGIFNVIDKSGKKQGYWKKRDQKDKLIYEGKFVDDKPVGTFKYYDEDGKTIAITEFNADGVNAKTELFHVNGNKMGEGRYVNQKKDGQWNYFSEEGLLLSEEFYHLGKKTGTHKVLHKNGNIAEEKNWVNDVEEGIWKAFYEDNQLRSEGKYVHGFLDGPLTFYYSNGKPKMRGFYVDAVRDSIWTYYKEDGEVDYIEKYDLGVLEEGGRQEDLLLTPEEIEKAKEDYEKENNSFQIRPKE